MGVGGMGANLVRALVALLALLGGALPVAAAQTLSERQQRQAESFAVNNTRFILYHEMAHLLFDQLGLPVLGREEDAADNVATYLLLSKQTRTSDKVLSDAARGWQLYGKLYGGDLGLEDFYDEHSLDSQRAFQIVCLMVGSDYDAFHKIADEYGMDKERQESCARDYRLARRSLDSLLETHRHKAGGKGTEVTITYHAASNELGKARDVFRNSGVFEDVADELRGSFALRNKVSFRAKRCGEVNAFYDPDTVEIIFCYEMMDDLLAMISNEMPDEPTGPVAHGRAGSASTQ